MLGVSASKFRDRDIATYGRSGTNDGDAGMVLGTALWYLHSGSRKRGAENRCQVEVTGTKCQRTRPRANKVGAKVDMAPSGVFRRSTSRSYTD